ncbi:MAG: MerR family transcriptional regulator [Clostridia bacterium]
MEKEKMLFSIGDFADIHKINKRTLQYYDKINLFSPLYVDKNNYRFYSYMQSATLEMILAMRELDMSIDEIKEYTKSPSKDAFSKIIDDKITEIDGKISELKEIRSLFCKKKQQLSISETTDLDAIDFIDCKKEYLLLSKPISGLYDEVDLEILLSHANEHKDHRLFNKSYGSMISFEKIKEHNFFNYDCFFTKISNAKNKKNYYEKPAGKYLRTFYKGNWDNLYTAYIRILEFAEKNDIPLYGFAFEEGINEMTIQNMNDYITQITILTEKSTL